MKIHSVKIENYKSIGGDAYNEIVIEPTTTAVIGRNESGKSNILEALSKISFITKMGDSVFDGNVLNRNTRNGEIKFLIILKPTTEERDVIQQDTIITITKNSYSATGGIMDYFTDALKTELDAFYEFATGTIFQLASKEGDTLNQRRRQIKVGTSLDIPAINNAISFFYQWKTKVKKEKQAEYNKFIDSLYEKWKQLCNFFPHIFFHNDKRTLKTEYKVDSIKTELKSKDSSLRALFRFLGFSDEQVLQTVSGRTDGQTADLQDRIQEQIDTKINNPFHDFYTVETVNLKVRFNTNVLSFSVKADHGATMTLGERSDGLRWYLNLFIDVLAGNIPSRQVVYLFDEPGISLHVNAQKELLNLFTDLTSKGNQVVYTTHSPYMLDTAENGIERIRAVVKDETENTRIYKTAYDANITSISKKDTLTPIIQALGMTLSATFGPALGKFNIVTEGVSDCVYLTAIGQVIKTDLNNIAFIRAVGASNCINICTILHGWGCRYMALFDYDNEGVVKGGEVFRKKYDMAYKKHYLYIANASAEDIEAKTFRTEEVEIESLVPDLSSFLQSRGYNDVGKVLTAKLYADALKDGSYTCPQGTCNNFQQLFERIYACAEAQKNERGNS